MGHTMRTIPVTADLSGHTLAAVVRGIRPELTWSQVRRLIATRHVRIGGEVCLDAARRLNAGETVDVLPRPAAAPRTRESIIIRHGDEHVVVVEKPAGVSTVRHPAERDWS